MQLSDTMQGLLGRLKRLLPLLLLLTAAAANAMLCATSVIPAVRTFDAADAQRRDAQAALDALSQGSDGEMMLRVLNRQLEGSQAELAQLGESFLTEAQVNELIERLYWYADRAGVQVVSMQSQDSVSAVATADGATPAPDASPYETRYLRLQVQGRMTDLIQYVVNLREASLPAASVDALDLMQNADTALLTFSLTLYSSPHATGLLLTQLPPRAQVAPLTSSSLQVAVLPSPTATATAEAQPSPTLVPPTLTPTLPPSPTFAFTATFTPTLPPPSPTATPPEALVRLASMEEPPVEVLFAESFDQDPLYAWTLGTGWSLVGVQGGRALQAAAGTGESVLLRYGALGDAVIEMRFLLESGSMRVRLRGSSAGSYTLELRDSGAMTLYRADVPIQTAAFPGALAGTWRTLRFSAFSSILRLAIDNTEQMLAYDSLALPPGDIAITNGGGVLYVDDVTVWTAAG